MDGSNPHRRSRRVRAIEVRLYSFPKFDAATLTVKEMHLQENTVFDLDLGVKVTQDVTQYLLHHVTYANVKFEDATSNGLGGDAFTRQYII